MSAEISERCLVSGTDGHVTVTPAGRVILTESASALRGDDVDRIADDVGSDVALRTLAGHGGTAALLEQTDGPLKLTITGRIGALIELPTASWFVSPTGGDGHTVAIPGDALRFAVAVDAVAPADLSPNTAASIATPDGQAASQFVIDLRVASQPDPTPVGLEVVDLSAAPDIAPAPLPIAAHAIVPPQPGRPQPAPPAQPAPPPPPQPDPPAPATPAASPGQPPPPSPRPQPAPPVPAQPAPPIAEQRATPGPGSAAAQSRDTLENANAVLGIRCPLDHHNHPEAEYCSQCGRKMGINATAVFVTGPRPPLGLFLLDDGGAIPLATDLLIGRDATTHHEVRSGQRQAVLLTDSSNVVSRHHLAITLDGWQVMVADLGSANGTVFVSGRTGATHTLRPDEQTPMHAGDVVRIGPRTLQLQLHHVA